MNVVDREIEIDNSIYKLAEEVKSLNSNNEEVVEEIAELYSKFLTKCKGKPFEWEVIHCNNLGGKYVIYKDNWIKIEPMENFAEMIAEWLVESVETYDNLDDAEKNLDLITEIFSEQITLMEHKKSEMEKLFEKLAKENSEYDLFEYYESVSENIETGRAVFFANPCEKSKTWKLIKSLEYIENIDKIEVDFSKCGDHDYEVIDVKWSLEK